jgi:hypothetical protein
MKRETLVMELNKTAAVFRCPLSTLAIDGYGEAFEGVPDADFVRACRRAREECDFMPTIKQLRAFLPDRRGQAAIEETNRWLARNAASRPKSWPRLGPTEPTPVGELVGRYLDPPDKVH